ncbi:peptidase M36 [Dokdonia pacifica]|uniref:Por secretion system C-terminal sorting domain-containing protein n=1 Tax=Dokdonia pacifica TaxID=1627892 RepID=A0A239AVK6_9FLAO|nr:T9SS-dependent M36 family metallopeptidase [Dokdonia pacifica]GGG31721.1 peptidase M36 [Dokdonia pacifica]SNR98998.1 Por secretion system C-terminal sorting domain-containing protein [Dokdonia pacifica]
MLKSYKLLLALCVVIFTSALSAQDYGILIKNHLETNKNVFGITDQDISGLTIQNEVFSKKSNTTHVYAIQKINNIEIFNGVINVAFKDGIIIHVANNLQSDIASRVNVVSPVLSPIQAASNAATSLGLGNANFSLDQTISSQEFVLTQGGVSLEKVPVKLVYQSMEDHTIRLAWDLSIHTTDAKHWYSVRVDALNGTLLQQHDWVVNCKFENHDHESSSVTTNTFISGFGVREEIIANELLAGEQYNVFPLPVESPNHGINQLVVDPQNTIASPFGWHDTNGVEGAEFTITRGNNVYAYEDINPDNAPGASPDGGDALDFNFAYNFNTEPVNMVDATTTNLFYWNNILHDITYQYGFDEASGNFQENNYGNGGGQGDSVNAESQEGNSFGGAFFGTPPDGANPRMRVGLFNPSTAPTEVLTIDGGSLDGGYIGTPANFGDPLPDDIPLEGELALTEDDNAGNSTDSIDACDTIINGADLAGNIAIIRRGECEFGVKVLAAENEGAIAVIMVNNVEGPPTIMGPGAVGNQVSIPSIMVSQSDGEAIIAALQGGEVINGSLINSGSFQIDGSLDNAVVAHEYAHGISNRLTGGGTNVSCLQNEEQMGEGWSDYFGMVLTMTADDFAEEARGIGTYAFGQSADGPGIRPRPYSTDFAVNDLTYGDVSDAANISVPHGVGTIWSTILWDMTWAFIDEYGFDDDFYNGTGGNNIALQLVIDGMKLQSCSPGFVDGRDGILAAVEINTIIPEDEKDFATCTIWNVFATRGVGFSAEQGSSNNRFDQTEAFDLPSDVIESCEDLLSVNENDLDTVFNIFPNPSNGEITVNVAGTFGEGNIRIYDINGREVYNKPATLQGRVSVNATGLARGVYIMNIVNDSTTYTSKIIIQ